MKQSLKQRLIGAIVLVALAVIFLPMLLTGPVDRGQVSVPVEIPPKPEVQPSSQLPQPDDETATRPPPSSITEAPTPVDEAGPQTEVEEPAATGSAAEAPAADDASEPAEAEPAPSGDQAGEEAATAAEPEAPDAGTDEPEGVPEQGGFAVQVGGFRNRGNALGLRDKLRDEGYTVYVDQTQWQGGPLYRVRVGPVISESEAETLKDRLAREQDLSGIVVSR